MLSFLQAHKNEPGDNEITERAILDKKSLRFLMSSADAETVLSTFRSNFDSGDYRISARQRVKIWAFGLWNTAYGNVVSFILHMSLEKIRLSIEPPTGSDTRVRLVIRLVENGEKG